MLSAVSNLPDSDSCMKDCRTIQEIYPDLKSEEVQLILQQFNGDLNESLAAIASGEFKSILLDWKFVSNSSSKPKKSPQQAEESPTTKYQTANSGAKSQEPNTSPKKMASSSEQTIRSKQTTTLTSFEDLEPNRVDSGCDISPVSFPSEVSLEWQASEPHSVASKENMYKPDEFKVNESKPSTEPNTAGNNRWKNSNRKNKRRERKSSKTEGNEESEGKLMEKPHLTNRQASLSSLDSGTGSSFSTASRGNSKNYSKLLNDVKKTSINLTKCRSMFIKEVDESKARIKKDFQKLHKLLEEREQFLYERVDELKKEIEAEMDKREKDGHDILSNANVAHGIGSDAIETMRTHMKHYVMDRRIDDEIAKTTRFVRDDEHMVKEIEEYGEVHGLNPMHAYRTYNINLKSTSALNGATSDNKPTVNPEMNSRVDLIPKRQSYDGRKPMQNNFAVSKQQQSPKARGFNDQRASHSPMTFRPQRTRGQDAKFRNRKPQHNGYDLRPTTKDLPNEKQPASSKDSTPAQALWDCIAENSINGLN